jgi:hypothetical protein
MPKSLLIASISVFLGAGVLAPVTSAQMRSVGFSGSGRGIGVSFTGAPRSRSFGSGAIFFGDGFYADNPVTPLTIPPQYVVVQPAPTIADTPPETKSEPLMIELQGDRYVRFGGRQQSAERGTTAMPDYAAADTGRSWRPQSPLELPPAVLIFRDGHREQVPEYAIIGGTLYASADYWQTGQWTKNIQLSTLNIPATVRANQEKGIKFTLPSAPNEVVTRP